MRFFWFLVLITILAIFLNLFFSKGSEIIITLIIIDFITLWMYIETEKKGIEKGILLEKIENLERLTSELFENISKKFSNKKNDLKELIKWLNNF